MSNKKTLSLAIEGDNDCVISIIIGTSRAADSLLVSEVLADALSNFLKTHNKKTGREIKLVSNDSEVVLGSKIYNGYPVSYWHQQAVHYRQRMIEIARQSDMAIDAEPSPNGIERE